MVAFMLNNPEKMAGSEGKTRECGAELANQLTNMVGVQSELAAVFSSPGAGTALQTALTDTGTAGRALNDKLIEIADNIARARLQIEQSDADARSQIGAALGGGTVPAGSSGKVDTGF
ncbi:hypothetical protein [Nocardia brasiliensis]|uniref:hypothetical protein n=1 Tax=Nocardia brasiliensis TaxID=37326 RepID=UPI002457A0AF|nr:hypothetical protein [Nocardia brasiliensis]